MGLPKWLSGGRICLPLQEMWVRSLGGEDLENEIAAHSSTPVWEILWKEKPGGLQSMGSPKSQTLDWACMRVSAFKLWLWKLWGCKLELDSVQSLSHVRLFATPWTASRQASLSITSSRSPPRPMSFELVMPSNHLILCCPLLLLPSVFPSIRVFSNESALCIRWSKYWNFSFSQSWCYGNKWCLSGSE